MGGPARVNCDKRHGPKSSDSTSCETIQMKMSLICMKMDVKVKLIFI